MNIIKYITLAFSFLIFNFGTSQKNGLPIIKEGKWGVISLTGEEIIAPIYDYISPFRNGDAVAKTNGRYGVITIDHAIKIQFEYLQLEYVYKQIDTLQSTEVTNEKSYYLAKKKSGFGAIDSMGKTVVPFAFENVQIARPNYYFVQLKGKWAIGKLGEDPFTTFNYRKISFLGGRFFKVEGKGGCILNDKGDTVYVGKYLRPTYIENHLLLNIDKKKKILIDNDGYVVIDTSYKNISINSSDGVVRAKKNRQLSFYLLREKRWINWGEFDNVEKIKDNLYKVFHTNKIGYMDGVKNVLMPVLFNRVIEFNNYYKVYRNNKVGIYSKSFSLIAKCVYDDVIWDQNAFITKTGEKYGVITQNGKVIEEPIFEEIIMFEKSMKGYKDKGLVQYLFDDENQITSQKEFNNAIKVRIKGSSLRFGGQNMSLSASRGNQPESVGWFLGTKDIFRNGDTITLRRWGLMSNADTVAIVPKHYKEVDVLSTVPLTKAYRFKLRAPFPDMERKAYTMPYTATFDIVNHREKTVADKSTFVALCSGDYENSNVARSLNYKRIGLVDSSGTPLTIKASYIGDFKSGMARYCYTKKRPKYVKEPEDEKTISSRIFWAPYFTDISPGSTIYSPLKPNVYFPESQWGYFNSDGEESFAPQFDYAFSFNNGFGIVKKDNLYGIVDRDTITVSTSFSKIKSISNFSDTLFYVHSPGGYHKREYVDSLFQPSSVSFSRMLLDQDGDLLVKADKNWGVMHSNLKWKVHPVNHYLIDYNQHFLLIKKKRKYGVSNESGSIIIEPEYQKPLVFEKGFIIAETKKKKGVFDSNGNLLVPLEHNHIKITNDKIITNKGIYNLDGEQITKPKYTHVDIDSISGYTLFYKKKHTKIIYKPEKIKITLKKVQGTTIYNKNVIFQTLGNEGLINLSGKIIIKPEYDKIQPLTTHLYSVKNGKNYGLMDSTGQQLLECSYRQIFQVFDSVYVAVGSNSVFFDEKGNVLYEDVFIDVKKESSGYFLCRRRNQEFVFLNKQFHNYFMQTFNNGNPFIGGLASVKNKHGWILINTRGEELNFPSFNQVISYAPNLYEVSYSTNLGIVEGNGKIIVPPEYEHVLYIGNNLFQISKNGLVGYINTRGEWVYNPF